MNQVEIKRKQIQFFSYCLAGINVWVFGKQLGNNGGLFGGAFLVFLFFWILTGKNVPDRLGRLLRSRNAKGQYKNVSKMRRNMMIFQIAARGWSVRCSVRHLDILCWKKRFGFPTEV